MRRFIRILLAALAVASVATPLLLAVDATAQEEVAKITLKGRIQGGQFLLNPVWAEAKDPKNHRYTFRQPSQTVGKGAKTLSAYLPKELCIAALSDKTTLASGTPILVHVSGGRTTPTTLVVPVGQNVQFINDDPFPHRLYSVKTGSGALGPDLMKPTAQRTWKPPGVGVWEIRDKNFPSVRSWIVVDEKVAASGYPNPKNEFFVPDVPKGNFTLHAYFSGKKIGDSVKVTVRSAPDVQQVNNPVVVAKAPKKDK